jgi:hypothetical protein
MIVVKTWIEKKTFKDGSVTYTPMFEKASYIFDNPKFHHKWLSFYIDKGMIAFSDLKYLSNEDFPTARYKEGSLDRAKQLVDAYILSEKNRENWLASVTVDKVEKIKYP